jgi:hypothetical protein
MNIKRLLQVGLILAGCSALPGWAVMINDGGAYDGVNVGSIDSFIAEDHFAGSPTEEENWVNLILGAGSVTFTVKNEPVNYFGTDSNGVYAFGLASAPEYFLIKNSTRMALFQNLNDVNWGVFDSSELSDTMNIPGDKFTISHVTEFNGQTEVPEPGVLGLLGMGLIGIVLGRRRMAA